MLLQLQNSESDRIDKLVVLCNSSLSTNLARPSWMKSMHFKALKICSTKHDISLPSNVYNTLNWLLIHVKDIHAFEFVIMTKVHIIFGIGNLSPHISERSSCLYVIDYSELFFFHFWEHHHFFLIHIWKWCNVAKSDVTWNKSLQEW